LVALGSLVGCADNLELKKAHDEADEAKAELGKVKAELDQLKAQRAAQQREESMAVDVGKEFIELVRTKRPDKAYQLASASFQKKMFPRGLPGAPEIRASDPLVKKYPSILKLEPIKHSQHKLTKSANGKSYAYFCHARQYSAEVLAFAASGYDLNPGTGPWIEFTLTILREDGSWKVDMVEVDEQ
jgi:hypothetical protein